MSDLFGALASRALGVAHTIAPRVPSRFEPVTPAGPAPYGGEDSIAERARVAMPSDGVVAERTGPPSQEATAIEVRPDASAPHRADESMPLLAEQRPALQHVDAFRAVVAASHASVDDVVSQPATIDATHDRLADESQVREVPDHVGSVGRDAAGRDARVSSSLSRVRDGEQLEAEMTERGGEAARVSDPSQPDDAARTSPLRNDSASHDRSARAPRSEDATQDVAGAALRERGPTHARDVSFEDESSLFAAEGAGEWPMSDGSEGARTRSLVRLHDDGESFSRFPHVALFDNPTREAPERRERIGTRVPTDADADLETPPVVHVHIGRVDVRMMPATAAPPRAARTVAEPKVPLDTYLRNSGRPPA